MADQSDDDPPGVGGSNSKKFIDELLRALPTLRREVKNEFDQVKADHERKKKEIEIGKLGILIGDKDHAPSRVAFLVIVFCGLLLFVIVLVIAAGKGESKLLGTITTGVISIFTAALGYLFGRGPSRR